VLRVEIDLNAIQVTEQKHAAEEALQDKNKEVYEYRAQMEAEAEGLKSRLRLEVEKMQGRVNAAQSEKRAVQEEVDKLGSTAQSLSERLQHAESQVEELRALARRDAQELAKDQAAMSEEHQADVHRLTSELERTNISLVDARRDLDIANQHKRSRDKEIAHLEHKLSALDDDFRQLQRSSEGEIAQLKLLLASTENQARSEIGMMREQLSLVKDGRKTDLHKQVYDHEAKDAEIEELRAVVVSLEGRLAQAEANRARDREQVVRSEQKLLSCEERLRQSIAAEQEASERADYMERALAQKQELDALRNRSHGVKEMEVKALEHRLLMAKHEAAAQHSSLETELRDVKSRLAAKDAEARDFFHRVAGKEEELRRLGQSKQSADRRIVELNEEIAALRREVQMTSQHRLQHPQLLVCHPCMSSLHGFSRLLSKNCLSCA
jgi:chromosome segregation ATPase